jgi:hypothetical protein
MQSVVRFSLAGILAVASLTSLTACGDKVNVQQPAVDSTVHSVTVTPGTVTLNVGQKTTLVASVQAGPGVTNLGVTWSSSNNAIATVTATGEVTAVSAGTTTIVAASAAKPDVKGAAGVTVNAVGVPTVSIASTNTTVCGTNGTCNSVPANLQDFGTGSPTGGTGQLDVIANVEPNGVALKSVDGKLTCGGKTITASQSLSSEAAIVDAEGNAAPVTLSFNTTALDASGQPLVFNTGPFNLGSTTTVPPCTLSVSLAPVTGTAPPASTTSVQLHNADIATLTTTNANGAQANDQNGALWKSGDIKVTAVPALYSQRGVQQVVITLPGAVGEAQTVTSTGGSVSATWVNGTGANNVQQKTLSAGNSANGVALPVIPTVRIVDAKGNDVTLPQPATNPASQYQILVDNQSPQAPQTFQIVQTQGQWVNGAYVFFKAGASGDLPAVATQKFVSCGDAPVTSANPAAPTCDTQGGVSAAPAFFTTANGVNGGANPNAGPAAGPILRVFAFDASVASPPNALTNGTSTSATTCGALLVAANNWIEVTTNSAALQEGPNNQRYVIRALEVDRLGNQRCSDLATADHTINTGAFARARLGVDLQPPAVPNNRLANSDESAGAADDHQIVSIAAPTVPSFTFSASDNLSGLGGTPVLHTLKRQNASNAAACVIGVGNSCTPAAASISPVPANGGSTANGYYTYTASVMDLATNTTALPARTVLIDKTAPAMGGISIPSTIAGGSNVNFNTSATDDLDLVSSDFTLAYPVTPTGGGAALAIRAPGPSLGAAFDATLTTSSSFSYNVPFFVRTIATTDAAGTPGGTATAKTPNQFTGRVYDAAGNPSAPSSSAIAPNAVPTANLTDFTAPQTTPVGAQFCGIVACGGVPGWAITNAATSVSNCPASGCTGGAAAANATSVVLTAKASGNEQAGPPAFQFSNPFPNGVSFYYLDPASSEWVLAGSAGAPTVSDNVSATVRTLTYSFTFDPPASLGTGGIQLIAVGANARGDALVTPANLNITLTNP